MEEKNKTRNSLLVLGSVILLVGLSAVIPARWLGVKSVASSHTPIDFKKLKGTNTALKDTNGDGVITWKELVLGNTDLTSSSSDISATKPDPEITKALNDKNNLTASFSKNLYITSSYLANNNITDADSQQKAMEGITSEEIAKTASKKYLYSDIQVATVESKETIRAYGNEMGKILNNTITKKNIMDDLPGVISFVNSKDEKFLTPIQADAKRIATVVQKILAVRVPPSAVIYHLIVLNQMVIYRDTLTNLSTAATDPVRAAIVIQKYPEEMRSTLLLYKKLSDYFNLKNMVFLPQEGGYVFTIGYTLE